MKTSMTHFFHFEDTHGLLQHCIEHRALKRSAAAVTKSVPLVIAGLLLIILTASSHRPRWQYVDASRNSLRWVSLISSAQRRASSDRPKTLYVSEIFEAASSEFSGHTE